jgi:hypothetical protein
MGSRSAKVLSTSHSAPTAECDLFLRRVPIFVAADRIDPFFS